MIDRPSWEEYFLNLAVAASERSTCPSRKVGAVIVNPETQQIIAVGYNGAAKGTKHCGPECLTRESGKSYEKCRAIHAEINAIVAAAMGGASTRYGTIYLTTTPCLGCARVLINAGIKKIVAPSFYPNQDAIMLLEEAGIDVEIYERGAR